MSTAVMVQDSPPPAGTALAVAAPRVSLIRPIAAPQEVVQAQEETRAMVAAALKKDRDYGVIPGTDKPALLKPGAERVALGFGCYYGDPEIIEKEIDHDREVHWTTKKGEARTSYGLYRYVVRVPVILRETGAVVGYGMGSCSTLESKYVSRPRDCENTVIKMAHKRGMVAACLITFGLSDQFTQDEDVIAAQRGEEGSASAAASHGANEPEAACPKCGGTMWDNRGTPEKPKRNPKAPDFKCRDSDCGGVFWPGQWPPKAEEPKPAAAAGAGATDRSFPDTFPIRELRGKRVADATTPQLEAALAAVRERNAEKWVAFLSDVLEERRAAAPAQSELPIGGAAAGAPAGSTRMDVPKGGNVADALPKNERAAGLENEDDDLPF